MVVEAGHEKERMIRGWRRGFAIIVAEVAK